MFKITKEEFGLAIVLATFGYFMSSRDWLNYMINMNPLQGFFVYEIITFAGLMLLSHMGLVIYKFRIDNWLKIIGLFMITTAWFICVNWTSPYIQYISTGSLNGASNIFYNSEDGAAWYFWFTYMNIIDIELVRLLTYVVTPFLLTLFGSLFVSERIRL